jgi:hypothetical protein
VCGGRGEGQRCSPSLLACRRLRCAPAHRERPAGPAAQPAPLPRRPRCPAGPAAPPAPLPRRPRRPTLRMLVMPSVPWQPHAASKSCRRYSIWKTGLPAGGGGALAGGAQAMRGSGRGTRRRNAAHCAAAEAARRGLAGRQALTGLGGRVVGALGEALALPGRGRGAAATEGGSRSARTRPAGPQQVQTPVPVQALCLMLPLTR